MRLIAIFGGPGGGAIVAQSLRALAAAGAEIRLLGFLNDVLAPGSLVSGVPVLGPFSAWPSLPPETVFAASLHKAKENPARAELVRKLGVPAHRWTTVIDPLSAVAADAVIGGGCFIGPFATVGPNARIGAHTTVRAGACVSHDCALGEFVFLGSGAVVCGYAEAGEGAYIAPNATICDRCRVGRFAVVGLGSVVTRDVPDHLVSIGNPSRAAAGAPPDATDA